MLGGPHGGVRVSGEGETINPSPQRLSVQPPGRDLCSAGRWRRERGEGIPAPGAAALPGPADEPGAEGAIGASLFASRAVGKESSSAG